MGKQRKRGKKKVKIRKTTITTKGIKVSECLSHLTQAWRNGVRMRIYCKWLPRLVLSVQQARKSILTFKYFFSSFQLFSSLFHNSIKISNFFFHSKIQYSPFMSFCLSRISLFVLAAKAFLNSTIQYPMSSACSRPFYPIMKFFFRFYARKHSRNQ